MGHTRCVAYTCSIVNRLGQRLSLDLELEGSDRVLWLVESVEGVVDCGDVGVDVADGLGDGGAGAFVELSCWGGNGQDWEEEVGSEHGC